MVRAHDGVELHGVKSGGSRVSQAVLCKLKADTATVEPGSDHVAGIGNVRSQAAVVRLQRVSADNLPVVLGDVGRESRPIQYSFAAASEMSVSRK